MKTCTTVATRSQLHIDDAVAANARHQRLGFISTRGWFCARSSRGGSYLCPLVINRTIPWVDSGHIGQTYGLNEDWPKYEVAGYTRAIDYDARWSREDYTRRQGNYPTLGGTPMSPQKP